MNEDIIKEKIRFETERFKLFFSSMAILIGGSLSLLSKPQLEMRELLVLLLGVVSLFTVAILAVKTDKNIESLFKKFRR